MALEEGTRLGDYEILSSLGAGGMGEVYRAEDQKLGRQVAIKVLPGEFTDEPERMARFEREAKVLASLNHHNIATLYGFESEGDTQFLVMELVEGETLGERIARGPIPVDEAVALFLQIAEGLEAAHDLGIVHRDLKPANIKVTAEAPGTPDRVKILDFGLAKAVAPEETSVGGTSVGSPVSESPTLTMATMRGMILGTAAYMSPEQARGKKVDRRTDIWAFGACLYEALTGTKTFEGETPTDIIAQVLTREPDWDRLPASTPRRLRHLLARCLDRDPRRRLRDIGEAWVDLDAVASGNAETVETEMASEAAPASLATGAGLGPRLAWLALGALVAGVATWAYMRPTPLPPSPLRRFTVDLGPTSPFPVMEVSSMIALSPDGTKLAAAINRGGGAPDLFLRSLDSLELTRVEGGGFAYAPFFSPDGQWIAFHEPGSQKLKKVPVAGGAVQTLCDAYPPLGGTWLEDGTLVFTSQGTNAPALFRVASTGGERQRLTDPEPSETHAFPAALPGDKGVLVSRGSLSPQGQTSSIDLLDLDTGTLTPLVENAALANYASSGHIVFVRQGALWAVPFDLDSLAVTGPEVLVQDGLEGGLLYTPWALATQGLLVYSPRVEGSVGGAVRLAWLDRQGGEQPIDVGTASFNQPRISHDGRKLAVLVADVQQLRNDLWVYDLGGRPPIRLTSDLLVSSPVWTPDDSGITFNDNRAAQVRTIPSDGSSQVGGVIDIRVDGVGGPQGWTPDGRELLVGLAGGADGQGVHTIVVSEAGDQRQLMQTDFHVFGVELSPDGHWVAYLSNATGAMEVYVRPYPGPGPQHRVSANGADAVRWSRDGRELLFRSGPRMMAATFEPGPEPEIGPAVELFSRFAASWDVAPDGRFLVVLPVDTEGNTSTRLVLVDGFLDELRRLAPPQG